jgi:hypothetical protein
MDSVLFALCAQGYSLRSIPIRVSQSASWLIFSTLRGRNILAGGWLSFLYYAGIQSTQHSHSGQSICQLRYFSTLGSKYSCWWMVEILFFFITQGYSLRGIPSRVESVLARMIFSRVEIFLLVDGSEILFFCLCTQSTQHSHSSQSVCQLVDIFYP